MNTRQHKIALLASVLALGVFAATGSAFAAGTTMEKSPAKPEIATSEHTKSPVSHHRSEGTRHHAKMATNKAGKSELKPEPVSSKKH